MKEGDAIEHSVTEMWSNQHRKWVMFDPATDAARVRAFFVSPEWTRQGIGRAIMSACEEAICAAGFRRVEIIATLVGEPLYRAFSYPVTERYDIPMKDGLVLPVVRMMKNF